MVKYQSESLDRVFGALADPTRRAITERLSRSGASVTQLAEPFAVTLPAVMKHVGVLERAGLLEHWKEGRVRHCRLLPEPLAEADAWIAHYRAFWGTRFVGLREFLQEDQTNG